MDPVETRSADRLPPYSKVRVSCHTLDKQHVQEDKTEKLKCTEGAVTQTADDNESDLGGAT